MSPVTIKSKDLPRILHQKAGLAVSALVTVRFEKNKITVTPQSALEQAIAEGLADIKAGRTYGPFNTADEMIQSLHAYTRKRKIKVKRS